MSGFPQNLGEVRHQRCSRIICVFPRAMVFLDKSAMSHYQHLHLVTELYNAMHGYHADSSITTLENGFQLDFLDSAQQRVCSVSYDDQRPFTIELIGTASSDLQTLLENVSEKWSATLKSISEEI